MMHTNALSTRRSVLPHHREDAPSLQKKWMATMASTPTPNRTKKVTVSGLTALSATLSSTSRVSSDVN